MNYIFLDIDGVLNYKDYLEKREDIPLICPDCLERLKQIATAGSAELVLVSSWKELPEDHPYARYLTETLLQKGLSLYGKTDHGSDRPHGISVWLEQHPETENFVILDDDFSAADYETYHLHPHLIQTSFWENPGGLQEKHVKKAISILLRGNKIVH